MTLLAALVVLVLPRSRPADLATFRHDMAEFLDRRWDRTLDLADPNFAKVKQWLESRSDSLHFEVPLALAASRTIGCKTLAWRGHTATLICFMPGKVGTVVHVLVVDRSALTDAPGEAPQWAQVADWNSAAWSRGNKTYLALTIAGPEKLSECL